MSKRLISFSALLNPASGFFNPVHASYALREIVISGGFNKKQRASAPLKITDIAQSDAWLRAARAFLKSLPPVRRAELLSTPVTSL